MTLFVTKVPTIELKIILPYNKRVIVPCRIYIALVNSCNMNSKRDSIHAITLLLYGNIILRCIKATFLTNNVIKLSNMALSTIWEYICTLR